MLSVLSYNPELDSQTFVSADLIIADTPLLLTAATIAGAQTKPNEDAFAVCGDKDTILAAVFDGTTSLRPIAALEGQSGARFASHYLKDQLPSLDKTLSPRALLLELNCRLLQANLELGGSLTDTHSLPSSTATLLKLQNGELGFAHVGDSFGMTIDQNGTSKLFTDDKNAQFDKKMFELIQDVAARKNLSPRLAREDDEVKNALLAMFIDRNNQPAGTGSGLINGDPAVAQYIQAGTISLKGVSSILLGTDGLIPPGWTLDQETDRERMILAILSSGFETMFRLKHEAEDNDPDWQHTRYKHSDDATGLLIELA